MAVVHFRNKVGKVGKASPHAAYIARLGEYEKRLQKEKLEATGFGNMPKWAENDPIEFWRSADLFERKNGSTYREFEIALPRELDEKQRLALVESWIKQEIGDKYAYQYAIHTPKALDDLDQPHVHLMFNERIRDDLERDPQQYFKRYNAKHPERGGLKKDNTGKDPQTRREELKALRGRWENIVNHHLEQAGVDTRISMKSLKAQGIDREPELKLLPSQSNELKKELAQQKAFDQKMEQGLQHVESQVPQFAQAQEQYDLMIERWMQHVEHENARKKREERLENERKRKRENQYQQQIEQEQAKRLEQQEQAQIARELLAKEKGEEYQANKAVPLEREVHRSQSPKNEPSPKKEPDRGFDHGM